ncbi:MAG: hypothetical protein H7Y06_02145, partial [Opitutaceae bacterium]|nr:hypothetical protein [Opitutaceae bacterium]
MKHKLTHHWLHLLPAALLTFTTGCSGPKVETTPKVVTTVTVVQPGVAGGFKVNTHQETATVTAVDKAARKVTLLKEDGTKSVITCGPEVVNFAQIEKGDRIVATLTERLVVFVRPP